MEGIGEVEENILEEKKEDQFVKVVGDMEQVMWAEELEEFN